MQPPAGPPSAVAAGAVPAVVADAATATAGGSSGLGAAALETAKAELAKGVKEEGVNTGTDVDKYLKEAGVAPGNPWCASFVTWALAQNGHKMEGGGWAAVQTWVQNAEAGNNNLEVVSAEDARPGDIVCYDWGGTGRTSAPTATSASWPATSRAASSPRWRATTRTGS